MAPPFGALRFPSFGARRRLRDQNDDEEDLEGHMPTHRARAGLPKIRRVDLSKALRGVQQNLQHHLTGVKKQIAKYQQSLRQHRDSKRSSKKAAGREKGRSSSRSRSKYGAAAEELVAKAVDYERNLDVRNAIKCYEAVLDLLPDSCEHLALCSKAWSDATYLDEIKGAHREPLSIQMKRDFNCKARTFAEKALLLGPDDSLPHVAACVSIGRLALFSDNKSKVALAKEAREHAVVAIEKRPSDDLAHHLMGRWHWEMAQLNVVARTLIRLAFGTALPSGSHADALVSYSTACKLAPHRLIHRVELGRAYHKLGKRLEAWRELEAAVLLDEEDINAHLQKIDADELLKDLRRDAKRHGWENGTPESQSMKSEC